MVLPLPPPLRHRQPRHSAKPGLVTFRRHTARPPLTAHSDTHKTQSQQFTAAHFAQLDQITLTKKKTICAQRNKSTNSTKKKLKTLLDKHPKRLLEIKQATTTKPTRLGERKHGNKTKTR